MISIVEFLAKTHLTAELPEKYETWDDLSEKVRKEIDPYLEDNGKVKKLNGHRVGSDNTLPYWFKLWAYLFDRGPSKLAEVKDFLGVKPGYYVNTDQDVKRKNIIKLVSRGVYLAEYIKNWKQ